MKCFASSIDGPGPKAAGTHGRGRERCDGHAAALCRPRPMNTVIAAFVDVRTRAKMAQRKKLAWYLLGLQPLLAIECLVTNEGWVADPVKAGAAGPPLQGLPPSHTRPPRSTAGHRDAACSAIFARIHMRPGFTQTRLLLPAVVIAV